MSSFSEEYKSRLEVLIAQQRRVIDALCKQLAELRAEDYIKQQAASMWMHRANAAEVENRRLMEIMGRYRDEEN